MENEKEQLLMAIAISAELTGTELSKTAARAMADELAQHPCGQVIGALAKCRRELKGRMSLNDILTRLDDGRPAPQEAWAIVAPTFDNEEPTIVWTEEMATAMGVARNCEDRIAARMAFLESYGQLCQKARDKGVAVKWTPSLGHDRHGRDGPLLAAVEAGRLPMSQVEPFLIGETARDDLVRIGLSAEVKALIRDFTTDEGLQP